jgi:hypothetical protein
MARTMKKFSAGGAQGRYDRRMADIEKDYAKAMTRKTGKAAEVAEAKRQQRIADAKDDFAKRTGADRTATRAAERTAESNLTKTRKYGAPKAVTTEASVSEPKVATVSAPLKSGLSTPAKKAPAKAADKPKPAATTPKRMGDQGFSSKKKDMATTGKGVSTHYRYVRGGSNSGAAADGTAAQRLKNKGLSTEDLKTGNKGTGANRIAAAADPKDTSAAASRARAGAALSYLNPFSYISDEANERYAKAQKAKGYAKGGKIMKKMSKGGSTPPQPTAAERKADAKFRESVKKEKVTPENAAAIGRGNRSEKRFAKGGVTKEMPSSKAMGSLNMAKGGKAKMKPAAKAKGKPFAATKFGAAMVKKSADTKGRAMPKFAKGGSIDGCAVKGKTKTSMVKMARGGAAQMRGRDHFGGAAFKKGGKTC